MAHKSHTNNPKPRRLSRCHRHPDLPSTTGLCATCLRECLSHLTPSSALDPSTSSLPELRRCKTYSANKCESAVGLSSFEPRRRSCDVRGRSTLSTLFNLDDDGDGDGVDRRLKVESRNLGFLSKGTCPVPELKEVDESDCDFEQARVSDLANLDEFDDSKTMKELIDLEFQPRNNSNNKGSNNRRDFREIAVTFWVAASVFSKKLQKWKKKQRSRTDGEDNGENGSGVGLGEMWLENLRGRRLRDTQSEAAEYGFGRRSCDMDPRGSLDLGRASIDCGGLGRRSCDSDPRFSIDIGRASIDCGRISVDEGRCSFDAPRASWDGYLIGRALPRSNAAPMVSVIENAMATVYGFDNRGLAEGKAKVGHGDERDSSSGRRKGFDQSNSLKRDVVVKDDGHGDGKTQSNARVSPAAIGIFNGTKLLITEKELNEWRLNSLRDDSSESFETASKDLASVSSSSNGPDFKKCRQWGKLWNIWGLLHRRKGNKFVDGEKLERGNEECSQGDSVDDPARNDNKKAESESDWKLVRSHSVASSRGSSTMSGSVREIRSRGESKALVKKRQEDVGLERSRSTRHSPNHLDNGLLRFYLTPLRSRRRGKLRKSGLKKSHSLARSVLRL